MAEHRETYGDVSWTITALENHSVRVSYQNNGFLDDSGEFYIPASVFRRAWQSISSDGQIMWDKDLFHDVITNDAQSRQMEPLTEQQKMLAINGALALFNYLRRIDEL